MNVSLSEALYLAAQEPRVLVIELFPIVAECMRCEALTESRWGVPVVNGSIVYNCYPEDDWGGAPVCRTCYEKHELASDIFEEYVWSLYREEEKE